jgi:endonuclease YncB( thermonuclease family)
VAFQRWPEERRDRVIGATVRLSGVALAFGAAVAAALAFVATMTFLDWKAGQAVQRAAVQQQNEVTILRPDPRPSVTPGPIDVIDGDTVRQQGFTYRLVGFDTPERGDRARCDDERQRAEKATQRLRSLISTGNPRLTRVACACRPGQEGTRNCNYGRLCGSLSIGGRDVGTILIGEGLAHPYVCSATNCPKRRQWC